MADISDITAYLAQTAANACYPNGTSQPSVAGIDIIIFEGWPIAERLDLDLTGQMLGPNKIPAPRPGGVRANVSVFPMQGTNVVPPQIQDATYIVTPPVYGLQVTLTPPTSGNAFSLTLAGTPGPTEFLTIDLDNLYIASATGSTIGAILAALAAQIVAFAPGYTAMVAGNTLTIGRAAYCIARLGASGVLGRVIHKQRQMIIVTVWAPDHTSRTLIAAAIDILIKRHITVTMPDTSMAKICFNRTNLTDEHEPVACYRRDLIIEAEYATLDLFPGTVITSVTTQISPLDPVGQNFPVCSVVA
jgi:hypothetical protein